MKRKIIILLFIAGMICFALIVRQVFVPADKDASDSDRLPLSSVHGTCDSLNALYHSGIVAISEKNDVEALDYFIRALQLSEKCSDPEKKADILVSLADIYYRANNYEKALQFYISAINYYSVKEKTKKIIRTLDNISNIYIDLKMYSNALQGLYKSRRYYLRQSGKNEKALMVNSMNIGVVYGQQEMADSSLLYFKTALNLAEKLDSQVVVGGVLNNIGAVYSKLDSIELAMQYFNNALLCFEEIDYNKGIGISLGNIGYVYQKQGKYNKAIGLYLKSIQYLVDSKANYQLLNTYQNMSDTYKQMGNSDAALKYNEMFLQLQDSIASADRVNKLLKIEMQNKISQKDNELKILEQQKLISEKESKIRQIKQYIFIGGLGLLVILGLLFLRNMRVSIKNIRLKQELLLSEKQQLATELELKNKDIEFYALRIVEKNDFLENLNREIEALHGADEDFRSLMKITGAIRSTLNIDNEALELESKINAVYSGFMSRLEEKFPDLSKTDKRLCSLMVLGLSSKDIALIMKITPESVKKGRYRLRKKLNLESEDDIAGFLKTL